MSSTSSATLAPEQISSRLQQLQGWTVEDGKRLVRSFRFKDFVQTVDFVNAITRVAEAEEHHPDLYVRWGEVIVYLTTHSAGGLTEKDFALASKIDKL